MKIPLEIFLTLITRFRIHVKCVLTEPETSLIRTYIYIYILNAVCAFFIF